MYFIKEQVPSPLPEASNLQIIQPLGCDFGLFSPLAHFSAKGKFLGGLFVRHERRGMQLSLHVTGTDRKLLAELLHMMISEI